MRVEKTIELQAEVSAVWDALTKPEQTKKYFYDCEAISDWQVGSSLIFRMDQSGIETIPVKGVITAIEPNSYLEHTCFASENEEDSSKHTTVTYSLTPKENVTMLAITQGEFDDDEDQSQHEASWDHVLGGLKAFLESSNS